GDGNAAAARGAAVTAAGAPGAVAAADSVAWNAPAAAASRTNRDTAGIMRGSARSGTSDRRSRRNRRAQSGYACACTSRLLPLINGLDSFIEMARRFLSRRLVVRRAPVRHDISKVGQNVAGFLTTKREKTRIGQKYRMRRESGNDCTAVADRDEHDAAGAPGRRPPGRHAGGGPLQTVVRCALPRGRRVCYLKPALLRAVSVRKN
ncbi:hypothetical protein KTF37_30210, partial [Burkholderia multivorans]|uniref:hypothetical protein n=1 Tax=Burkholderia multivorans TaxID=87883 RepID=UPI001C231D74